jgi:geranylgeranyl pyrophosphate synthase
MDDDQLRRGRPTCHIAFDEATAILAGDALLTLAFEWLADCPAPPPHAPNRLALELARAAGSRGVVGGQAVDLASEGRKVSLAEVEFIHRHKTADLIAAAVRIGAISAAAPLGAVDALGAYGMDLGIAFQIADDMLNVTSSPGELGKGVGTDAARGKVTYVTLLGLDGARDAARVHAGRALDHLEKAGLRSPALTALAGYAVDRTR